MRRSVGSVTVTTDDGSAGQRGRVTVPLSEAITRTGAQVVLRLRTDADAARGR